MLLTMAAVVNGRPTTIPEAGPTPLDQPTIDELRALATSITMPLVTVGCSHTISGNAVATEGGLVTNRHLVDEAARVTVSAAPLPATARVEIGSTGSGAASEDLAAISAGPTGERGGLPTGGQAGLADHDPLVGTPVLLAGWREGTLHAIEGRVHAYTFGGSYGPGEVMLLEPMVEIGFSGGPVLDRNGEIVGILRAIDPTTSLTLAIPASTIHAWQHVEKKQVGAATCN